MTATVHLITGSTGAGKTTYAMKLAQTENALRFSIDEWMVALYGPDRPDPLTYDWMMQRIDRAEAVIWRTVLDAAARGRSSVLDLGFTKQAHRAKFAGLAHAAGLQVRLHFLDVPAAERWRRVERRNAGQGETYAMTVDRGMFEFMEQMWQPPEMAELAALNGVKA